MLHSQFNKFFHSIVKESADEINDMQELGLTNAQIIKNEEPAKNKKEKEPEDDSGVKSLEKDFLNKFIRYNELQFLMRDLPEIANSFNSIKGFDEKLIRDTVEKLLEDRQKEIDTLTKELNELRDKITKEAEVANYKKSIIDIFNQEAKPENNQGESNFYGYGKPTDTTQNNQSRNDYMTGASLAGPDGVPTVSVGMPEVTQPEELPDELKEPEKIDDLQQAVNYSGDALTKANSDIPGRIPAQKKPSSNKKEPKRSTKTVNALNVLVDSKKKKSTSSTKNKAKK